MISRRGFIGSAFGAAFLAMWDSDELQKGANSRISWAGRVFVRTIGEKTKWMQMPGLVEVSQSANALTFKTGDLHASSYFMADRCVVLGPTGTTIAECPLVRTVSLCNGDILRLTANLVIPPNIDSIGELEKVLRDGKGKMQRV